MYIGFQHKVCVAFCSCEPEAVTQYVASFSEEPYTGFPSRYTSMAGVFSP